MKILVDTDILIDVALDRQPFADDSSLLLDALQAKQIEGYIAWHSISNLYYICSSGKKKQKIKAYINDLTDFLQVAETGTVAIKRALSIKINDFEDAMQIAAAFECGADIIATRNIVHYQKSPIPAHLPKQIIGSM